MAVPRGGQITMLKTKTGPEATFCLSFPARLLGLLFRCATPVSRVFRATYGLFFALQSHGTSGKRFPIS